MKKILSLLLVLTMVLSLAACTGGEDEPATTTTAKDADATTTKPDDGGETTPAEPKILKYLESSNIPSLITWQATDSVSFSILGNINSGLYTLSDTGAPVADLAESVEASADGLTYTFKLRDANWSTVDGEVYAPVTANDFVFTWKKLLDPAEASQYSFMISTAAIVNGAEAVALNEEIIAYEADVDSLSTMTVEDFEATDDKTPEQQFKAAKEDLEAAIAETEALFTEKYTSVDGAYTALATLVDELGVKALDDKTLEVKLANPVPYFLDLMTFPSFFPASEAFVTEKGDAYGKTNTDFLYNGAFIFKEWKISERHYIVKNENYWDAANVAIDGVDWRVIEGVDNETAIQMYLDGETMSTGLSGENVEKYGNRPDMISLEDTVLFYIEMNQGKGEMTTSKQLLSDVRARKAINMAVDKSYITDVIFANGSLPADYFVPKGFQANANLGGFRDLAEEKHGGKDGYNGYDPAAAAELWNAAKADLGIDAVEFELLIYQGDTAAQVGTHIQNELEKNLEGIKVIVEAIPFSEKLQRAENGEYELNWAGWGPDYPDAMTWMDMWITNGGHNATGYSDADYDAVIAETKEGALTAPDKVDERFEALVDLEYKLLAEDQVIMPLYQRAGIGLRDPRIKNLFPQKFGPDVIYKWVTLED